MASSRRLLYAGTTGDNCPPGNRSLSSLSSVLERSLRLLLLLNRLLAQGLIDHISLAVAVGLIGEAQIGERFLIQAEEALSMRAVKVSFTIPKVAFPHQHCFCEAGMDALETDIAKLKRAIAEADVADLKRRREREAELQRISGMVAELVARHESYFWSPTLFQQPTPRGR